jgi:hypothetical protein
MSKMKSIVTALAASMMAQASTAKGNKLKDTESIPIRNRYATPGAFGDTLYMPSTAFSSPIYFPKKHTKQSYRSQQRARVKRNKARGKNK